MVVLYAEVLPIDVFCVPLVLLYKLLYPIDVLKLPVDALNA